MPACAVRSQIALRVAEEAFGRAGVEGGGVYGGYLRQMGQQAISLAADAGGLEMVRRSDGTNLLHRLAWCPRGYEMARKAIEHWPGEDRRGRPGGDWSRKGMEAQKDVDGRTPGDRLQEAKARERTIARACKGGRER